jgi:hypothetical protein
MGMTKPCCGALLDADTESVTQVGHWVLCLTCAHPLILGVLGRLREPSNEDWESLSPEARDRIQFLIDNMKGALRE